MDKKIYKKLKLKEQNHMDTTKEVEELVDVYLEKCEISENSTIVYASWDEAKEDFYSCLKALEENFKYYKSNSPSKENAMALQKELKAYDLILDGMTDFLEGQQAEATPFLNYRLEELQEQIPHKIEDIDKYLDACFSYVKCVFEEIDRTYKERYSLREIDDSVMLLLFGLYTPLNSYWLNEMESHNWLTKKI
ncbi:MAG: hypothetical protein K5675_00880 [Lachnospiraceae bacterium]|nr:hypothetical protein [Lachnospiraceae bacterium]